MMRPLPAPRGEQTGGRVVAVVVTFHPDAGFPARCEAITKQVDRVIVVDNASSSEGMRQIELAQTAGNIHLLVQNKSNMGIAAALNQGVGAAAGMGAEWVLTMDQDTDVRGELTQRLLHLAEAYPHPQSIGTIGANYVDETGLLGDAGSKAQPARQVRTVVTSGSLLRVSAWRQVGGFREDLFIDSVDHDLCLRLRKAGYRVLMSAQPLMHHRLGHARRVRLLGRQFVVPNYPPTRRYYAARNRIAMARAHAVTEPIWIAAELLRLVLETMLMCFFEDDRLRKTRAVLRGLLDGVVGRMGRAPSGL